MTALCAFCRRLLKIFKKDDAEYYGSHRRHIPLPHRRHIPLPHRRMRTYLYPTDECGVQRCHGRIQMDMAVDQFVSCMLGPQIGIAPLTDIALHQPGDGAVPPRHGRNPHSRHDTTRLPAEQCSAGARERRGQQSDPRHGSCLPIPRLCQGIALCCCCVPDLRLFSQAMQRCLSSIRDEDLNNAQLR